MLCTNPQSMETPRLKQLEEQGETLKAEVERLCQRVAVLEASLAATPALLPQLPAAAAAVADPAPAVPVAAAEAELRQQEQPPQLPPAQQPGNETAVAESDVKVDVEVEESREAKSLRETAIAEVYTFQESMWDVQLFMGKLLGPADSALVAIYTMINILVQVFFCVIVWEMTYNTITDATISDLLFWRLGNGHTYKHFDSATNTSLVRRVCNNFGANNVAGSQQSLIVNFDAYLPRDSFAVGPWLCSLAVLIWVVTVLIDLWSTESFLVAVLSLRRREHGGRATKVLYAGDGQLRVVDISLRRTIYAVVFIVVPRVTIDILLLWGGIRFLVFENTLPGLILNAVALGFILGLDELIFQILPRRAQRIIETMEPVEKHVSFVHPKTSVDLRSVFIFVGCVAIVTATWFAYLDPKVTRIREAQILLCEGDVDFVYQTEAAVGMVEVTPTNATVTMQETHEILAVLQRTGLPMSSPLLEKYAPMLPATRLFEEVPYYELSEVAKRTRADALASLDCRDQDFDLVHARAMHSIYIGGFGHTATAGGFCPGIAAWKWCNNPLMAQFVNRLCPHSCQCDSMALYNRTLCTSRCNAYVHAKVTNEADQCIEPSYRSAGPELHSFYGNFLDYLVQKGRVERKAVANLSRTVLTPQWLERVFENTGHKYTMQSDTTVFPMGWNLTYWISAEQRSPLNVRSPCDYVPLINRIFEVDLCASVTTGSLGTIRGFCPLACHQSTCRSDRLHPQATFDQVAESQHGMSLTMGYRILYPVLSCGVATTLWTQTVAFTEQPAWSNGTYTVDLCDPVLAPHGPYGVFAYYATTTTNAVLRGDPSTCNFTVQLNSSDPSFFMVRSNAPDYTQFTATLHCHIDGTLTCGSTINGSTVGAVNSRGGPAGERIYDIDVPDQSVVSFETCGSQLDAGLSVYNYPTSTNGSLYQSQDGTSSCGSASGASLTLAMPTASQGLKLVVEGSDSSEGNFTVRTACSYPRIQCGDTIRGDTSSLRSSYGSDAPERIWRFSAGSSGVNITIDTCNSTFDTDIRFFSLDMVQLKYYDAGPVRPYVCGWKAHVTYPVAPNADFNILLEGYASQAGPFTLDFQCVP